MGEVSSSSLEAAEFLRHADFVRRLARRLAADEAAAEDLVQDTWLAALEHPPTQVRGVRAWLARVLRNQAALRRRTGARRVHRERTVARVDRTCMAGPNVLPNPPQRTTVQECLDAFDGDMEDDVDLTDFAKFQMAFSSE